MIVGSRRRELVDRLRSADREIRLCAPPGYGKSTFAVLLRDSGIAVSIRESRHAGTPSSAGDAIVVGPRELAFDGEEIAKAFSGTPVSPGILVRVEEMTGGWPVGVLYARRLARLDKLERALDDPSDPSLDDLYDYIDEQVLLPSDKTERASLLAAAAVPAQQQNAQVSFAQHPLIRSCMCVRHAPEMRRYCRRRAAATKRAHDALAAATWLIAAGDVTAAAGVLPREQYGPDELRFLAHAPFALLECRPDLWLRAWQERREHISGAQMLREASVIVGILDADGDPQPLRAAYVRFALAQAQEGNTAAALAACDAARTLPGSDDDRELRLLRSALEHRRFGTAIEPLRVLAATAPAESVARPLAFVQLAQDALSRSDREGFESCLRSVGEGRSHDVWFLRGLAGDAAPGDAELERWSRSGNRRVNAFALILRWTAGEVPARDGRDEAFRLVIAAEDRFLEDRARQLLTDARPAVQTRALRIDLFTGRVQLDGREIACAEREGAILFTLAASPARSMPSSRLAAAVWPDRNDSQRRGALKVAVSRLRTRLEFHQIVTVLEGSYSLNAGASVDLHDLECALERFALDGDETRLEPFRTALGASRPARIRDAEWFAHIEQRLVAGSHRLANVMAAAAARRNDTQAMRRIGLDLLNADPCDEEGCSLVVRSYVLEGKRDAARAEYDRFADHLAAALDCAPSLSFGALARSAAG